MSSNSVNYYKILGVARDADTNTILKKYKELSKKYHPDRNVGEEKTATEYFQQLSEAAEVLRDPQKRKIYDKYGISGLKSNNLFPTNMTDLFNMVFNDANKSDQNQDVVITQVEINVTLQECYNGVERNIAFFYNYNCPSCKGSILKEVKRKCNKCLDGKLTENVSSLKVKVPSGSQDKDIIRIKYEDNKKQIDGVVLVKINCEENDEYILKSSDLYLIQSVKISLYNTLMGGNLIINHFGHKLFIKPNFNIIQNNEYHKIEGKGMPATAKRTRNGDLFIKFQLIMSEKEMLLDELAIRQICALLPNEPQYDSQDIKDAIVVQLQQLNEFDKLELDLEEDNETDNKQTNECKQM